MRWRNHALKLCYTTDAIALAEMHNPRPSSFMPSVVVAIIVMFVAGLRALLNMSCSITFFDICPVSMQQFHIRSDFDGNQFSGFFPDKRRSVK
jgi:hypothetical protein